MAGMTAVLEVPHGRWTRRDPRSLTVCVLTAGPGPRVAALLETLRGVAQEILVALDDRADPSVRRDLATVADTIVLYPFAEPVDRPLPWLFGQARCGWTLSLDDDEIPSAELIEALPDLCADDRVVHYSIPRRWLYPDESRFLDDWPWRPDYQLRLLRTDAQFIRFSDDLHRPIVAAGPGRFLGTPVWHADALLRTRDRRLDKARAYERARPGMRVGAQALNFAFYVPELRDEPQLGVVPRADRDLIARVLGAVPPVGPEVAVVTRVTRDEIDAYWPDRSADAQAGMLELLERPVALRAGEQRTIDIRVHNVGTATWQWGSESAPQIRIGARWYTEDGGEVEGTRLWTPLPGPLEPGESDIVPVHVRAPDHPGRYRLDVDLLHEHVRWFGAAVTCMVLVEERRRVALAGHVTPELVLRLIEHDPDVEPLLLRRSPAASTCEGYAEAPDCRSYLFDDAPRGHLAFAVTLAWRSLRLLAGTPAGAAAFVAALRGSTRLAVADAEQPEQRRERWALRLVAWKARALGIPVVRLDDG